MRKVILIFGLLAGAAISIFQVVGIALWENTGKVIDNALVGYAVMVIALSMIFFGIKSYRDNYQSGEIRFWKGLQIGLLITLIASFLYALTWETYNRVRPASATAFIDYYVECQIDKLKRKGGAADAIDQEVKKINDFKIMYRNPAIRFGMTLLEIMPVGIIITLISAALLRKKEFLRA
jgi:Protein of unknown function (DUF4199)